MNWRKWNEDSLEKPGRGNFSSCALRATENQTVAKLSRRLSSPNQTAPIQSQPFCGPFLYTSAVEFGREVNYFGKLSVSSEATKSFSASTQSSKVNGWSGNLSRNIS